MLQAKFHGPFDPVYPCRILNTRHCPAIYNAVCGERLCARYESRDESPWTWEIARNPDESHIVRGYD